MSNEARKSPFLTSEQLRDRWSISESTLWRYEHVTGVIKSIRLGRRKLFALADIEAAEATAAEE